MKINFAKATDFAAPKGINSSAVAVLVLTEEQVKKSNLKPVKFAKENFEFTGKDNQAHVVSQDEKVVVLVGAGSEKKLDELALQKIGSRIVSLLNSTKIKNGSVFFDSKNSAADSANIAFGATLQSYRFNRYFENKKKYIEMAQRYSP